MCVNEFAFVSLFALRAIKNGGVQMKETRNTVAACVGIEWRDGTPSSGQYVGAALHSKQKQKTWWGHRIGATSIHH